MPEIAIRARALAAICVLASLAATPIAGADDPAVAQARAAAASIEQALAASPQDAVLAYFLGLFRTRAGDADGALDALEQSLATGDGFLPGDAFDALNGDPRFARLRARFEKRLPRVVDGRVVATLADRTLLPEGIAYDPVGRAFYVGSIPRRAIYRVAAGGRLERLSRDRDGLDDILGIAIDGAARRLYAVSTSALTATGRVKPRNAIKVYDLTTRKLVATFDIPDARQLNDVAIGQAGMLFVTDSAGSGVWRIDTRSGAAATLVPLGAARGANGIAAHPSGESIYVAAGRRPLHVDIATGAITPLALPPRENAAAIDGLYWHDGALIGIQNSTTPARVVRLVLAANGKSVTSVETLQSHHQRAFVEPTTGAIAPDGFHVLARTFVTRYNDRGELRDARTIEAPLILRIPLARG